VGYEDLNDHDRLRRDPLLAGTELARAQWDTLRLKLLKIGAQIRVTVRRVWISLAEGYAYAELFAQVCAQLRALPLRC
jgi:hypothetical protein